MDETSELLDLSSSGATGSSSTGGVAIIGGGAAVNAVTSRNLSINTGTTTDGPCYAGGI